MWGKMVQDGHFDREYLSAGPSIPSSPGDTLCAVVSASAWVEPHGKCTVAFALAWSSPKIKFLKGNAYHRYKFTLFNELYFLVAGGTVWTDGESPTVDENSSFGSGHHKSIKSANGNVRTTVAIANDKLCSVVEHTSSNGDATSSFKERDVDQESLMAEQRIYHPASNHYGYGYPGAFDGILELLVRAGRSLPEAITWKGTLLKQFIWKATWQFFCFENLK